MDEIQEHIRLNNVPSELPKGHRRRFKSKLSKDFPARYNNSRQLIIYSSVAAILIGIVFSLILLKSNTKEIKTGLILVDESAEAIETERYFQNEIANRISIIGSINIHGQKTFDIKTDLQDLDESLKNLKKDLEQTPGDQRIVEAVFNTYILKIETLDNIVDILHKNS